MTRQLARIIGTFAIVGLLQSSAAPAASAASLQMRVDGIQAPRKTRDVRPVYPLIAQSAGVQGIVILEARIDARGRVSDARVVRSIPLLDEAAIEAVRQWEFTPTTISGVPVPVILTVTVNFTLSGGPAAAAPATVPQAPAAAPAPSMPLEHRTRAMPRPPVPAPLDVAQPTRRTYPAPGADSSVRQFDETVKSLGLDGDDDPIVRKALRDLRALLSESDAETARTPAAAAPKGCSTQPSYGVTPLRWERFPLRVYIEEVELDRRGFSPQRKAEIVRLIMQGLGSWSAATGGRLGAVTHVRDFAGSDVNVVFRNNTGNTIHDRVQGPFIRHATIMWDVQRWEAFPDKDHRIVNGMAHEMGHVLGISAHPSTPGTLMVDGPEQLTFEAPQAADVNSMLNKYGICQ